MYQCRAEVCKATLARSAKATRNDQTASLSARVSKILNTKSC